MKGIIDQWRQSGEAVILAADSSEGPATFGFASDDAEIQGWRSLSGIYAPDIDADTAVLLPDEPAFLKWLLARVLP